MLMVCGIFGCLGHAFSRSPSSASLSTAEQQHHHGAHNIDRRQPGDRHHGRNARASSQNGLITAGPGAHGGGASSSSTGATSELDSRPAPGLGLHSLSPTLEQTPQVLSYDSDLPVGGGGVAAAVAAAAAATSQPAMLVKMERMGNPRRTPLHVAAERGQLHVLSAIIESLCCSATAAQLTEGTPSGTGSGDGDGGGGGGGHGRSSATGSVGGGAPAEAPGLLHPADFPHVNHQQQQQRYPQHPAPHAPPRNHPQQQQQRHTHQQGQHHPQQHHHQQPQPQLSRDRGQVGSSPAHGGGGGGGGTNPTSSGSPAPPMEEFPPLRPGAGGAPLAPEQFIQFHLNMQDVEGTTALSLACRFGHVDCCRLLLANGSARTLSDARGNTPLHYAALRGHLGVLFMLLDEFVEPGREEELAGYVDARNHAGCTPLHYAVWGRQSGSVQVLLQHGADVLPRNSRPAQELTPAVNVVGSTPLHLAAARGHVEICRIILKTFAERVLEPLQLTEDDPQPPTLASLDPRVQVNANGHMPYQVAQRLGFYPLAMLLRPSIPILRLFSDEERAIRFYGPAPLRAIAAEALNKKLLSELDALAATAPPPPPACTTPATGKQATMASAAAMLGSNIPARVTAPPQVLSLSAASTAASAATAVPPPAAGGSEAVGDTVAVRRPVSAPATLDQLAAAAAMDDDEDGGGSGVGSSGAAATAPANVVHVGPPAAGDGGAGWGTTGDAARSSGRSRRAGAVPSREASGGPPASSLQVQEERLAASGSSSRRTAAPRQLTVTVPSAGGGGGSSAAGAEGLEVLPYQQGRAGASSTPSPASPGPNSSNTSGGSVAGSSPQPVPPRTPLSVNTGGVAPVSPGRTTTPRSLIPPTPSPGGASASPSSPFSSSSPYHHHHQQQQQLEVTARSPRRCTPTLMGSRSTTALVPAAPLVSSLSRPPSAARANGGSIQCGPQRGSSVVLRLPGQPDVPELQQQLPLAGNGNSREQACDERAAAVVAVTGSGPGSSAGSNAADSSGSGNNNMANSSNNNGSSSSNIILHAGTVSMGGLATGEAHVRVSSLTSNSSASSRDEDQIHESSPNANSSSNAPFGPTTPVGRASSGALHVRRISLASPLRQPNNSPNLTNPRPATTSSAAATTGVGILLPTSVSMESVSSSPSMRRGMEDSRPPGLIRLRSNPLFESALEVAGSSSPNAARRASAATATAAASSSMPPLAEDSGEGDVAESASSSVTAATVASSSAAVTPFSHIPGSTNSSQTGAAAATAAAASTAVGSASSSNHNAVAAANKPSDCRGPSFTAAASAVLSYDVGDEDEELECGVCMEVLPMVAVSPCRHQICGPCARRICCLNIQKPSHCPFCRATISAFIAPAPPPSLEQRRA